MKIIFNFSLYTLASVFAPGLRDKTALVIMTRPHAAGDAQGVIAVVTPWEMPRGGTEFLEGLGGAQSSVVLESPSSEGVSVSPCPVSVRDFPDGKMWALAELFCGLAALYFLADELFKVR